MNITYELFYNNRIAGTVILNKEGAYYRINGKFNQNNPGLYRLYADNGIEFLNICMGIPQDGSVSFSARLPIRQLGKGEITFFVKQGNNKDLFVRFTEKNPFSYLDRLDSAYLDKQDGVCGIRIKY